MTETAIETTSCIDSAALIDSQFSSSLQAFRDSLRVLSGAGQSLSPLVNSRLQSPEFASIQAALSKLQELSPLLREATRSSRTLEGELSVAAPGRALPEVDPARVEKSNPRLSTPIFRQNIIAVVKRSDVSREIGRLGIGVDEFLAEHELRDSKTTNDLFAAHNDQEAALEELKRFLRADQILFSDEIELGTERLNRAAAIISFGGDDHLKLVSHFVPAGIPVVGVNSDPVRSHGALLDYWCSDLEALLSNLETGQYRLEPWSTLRIELDGKRLPRALDSIFLGERERKRMSRHLIEKRGLGLGDEPKVIAQKGSGLLVATGAGSTGWFQNETRPYFRFGATFEAGASYARYFNTVASNTTAGAADRRAEDYLPEGTEGVLYPDELLIVRSKNRTDGIVSTDSFEEFSFPRGSTAEISVSPEPLWIIRPLHLRER